MSHYLRWGMGVGTKLQDSFETINAMSQVRYWPNKHLALRCLTLLLTTNTICKQTVLHTGT